MHEIKVRYVREGHNGRSTTVTETYLTHTDSCTLAEAAVIDYITPFITSGGVDIRSIRGTRYERIVESPTMTEDGRWYKARVRFAYTDDLDKVHAHISPVLVVSDNIENAIATVLEEFSNLIEYDRVLSVTESPILEVLQQ